MGSGPLERTFQLIKGIGPWRERDLWARDVADWAAFEKAAASRVVASKRLDEELLVAIRAARQALQVGSLETLVKMVPAREHWRLYPYFADHAAFFDLEADGEEQITVAGILDRQGVAAFIRGRELDAFPARLAQSKIWVSFNGSVFDQPLLQKRYPELADPLVHIDLRVTLRKMRQQGGLKEIEQRLGLNRPAHLKGLRGDSAILLWRDWQLSGRREALQHLVEYNLYDAIHLKTLLEFAVNAIGDELAWNAERRPVFERGDVLYDVSRLLMSL